MKLKQNSPRHLVVLGLVVAGVLLGCAQSVTAQWSPIANPTPTPGTNIYYNSGNVGIGTASPVAKLDVAGTAQAQTLGVNSGNYSGSLYWGNASFAVWYMTGSDYSSSVRFKTWDGSAGYSDKVTFQNNGNVGIGTTTPDAPIHAAGGTPMAAGWNRTATLQGTYPVLTFNSGYTGSQKWAGLGYDFSAAMRFWVNAGSDVPNGTLAMSILNNGNVGIGTPTPESYKLNVNGDTNVAGNLNVVANGTSAGNIVAAGTIYAKYQDVAEWVPSSEQLAAGTVVVLDSTKSNQVIASSISYDTRVAGVISAQPGLVLGEKADNKVLVATTGRVKVKVDASKRPIHIGDLLVTSNIPGVAMKSEPVEIASRKMHMPGTLIGKALEPLEKGSGKILVLLSLQ